MVKHEKRMESNDVLRALADDLEEKMGFTVERGKKRLGKRPRPVFFGDEGRTYEPMRSTRLSPPTAVAFA